MHSIKLPCTHLVTHTFYHFLLQTPCTFDETIFHTYRNKCATNRDSPESNARLVLVIETREESKRYFYLSLLDSNIGPKEKAWIIVPQIIEM